MLTPVIWCVCVCVDLFNVMLASVPKNSTSLPKMLTHKQTFPWFLIASQCVYLSY